MECLETPIGGVIVVKSTRVADHRGAFARLFCERELASVLGGRNIAQINYSRTSDVGTVRGMHYQHVPHAEMKMVRCLRGKVWDVAVDLRKQSPTFLRWHAVELSAENNCMMVIPEGCAHGFQVLEAESELLYLHTDRYTPECEGGVCHDDPVLKIDWPLPVVGLSERDSLHPLINKDFCGIVL